MSNKKFFFVYYYNHEGKKIKILLNKILNFLKRYFGELEVNFILQYLTMRDISLIFSKHHKSKFKEENKKGSKNCGKSSGQSV